jgi:hypothetical protein
MSEPAKPAEKVPTKADLEKELEKLKGELAQKNAKENVIVGGGKKLGNINKKPIYCGHNCPKCPITIKEEKGVKVQIGHVAVQVIKNPDTRKVVDLQCKTMKSL